MKIRNARAKRSRIKKRIVANDGDVVVADDFGVVAAIVAAELWMEIRWAMMMMMMIVVAGKN